MSLSPGEWIVLGVIAVIIIATFILPPAPPKQ